MVESARLVFSTMVTASFGASLAACTTRQGRVTKESRELFLGGEQFAILSAGQYDDRLHPSPGKNLWFLREGLVHNFAECVLCLLELLHTFD